ncbi:prolyl 4-hydroxylase subunit alpha-1-like [Liolophura sinensis]|uniref:prolyl 4-hydroxylase subunit alpha-1-like n=1 Tax=Liolophura sinensis TaxID=3198878 RepID=UPI0031594CC4
MSMDSLSSSDCFQLAETAFRHGYSNTAAEWLAEALYLKDPSPKLAKSREEMVNQLLKSAKTRFKGLQCGHTEGSNTHDICHNSSKDGHGQDVDSTEPDGHGQSVDNTEPDGHGQDVESTEPDGHRQDVDSTEPDGHGQHVDSTEPDGQRQDVDNTEPGGHRQDVDSTEPDGHGQHVDSKEPDGHRQDVDSTAHVGCASLEGDALREEEIFTRLCRGDISVHQTGDSVRTCAYKRSKASYHGWKQEVLSGDPYIVLFHNVISEEEGQHLMDLSKNLLERSAVGQPDNGVIVEARISKVTWLWDNHTSIINKLSRRVEDITDLCTLFREKGACAEPFQVLNYGIGGQYHSHFDFYQDREMVKKTPSFVRDSGDRLATLMFYLSEVFAGGATVFPEVGVRIAPVKGAAAFWYNFKEGRADLRTKHGGCPVLRGEKWVANKWIHEIAKASLR